MVEAPRQATAPRGWVSRLLRFLSILFPAFLFLAVLEVGCLLFYFQARGPEVFGLQAALGDLAEILRGKMAESGARSVRKLPPAPEIYRALFAPAGAALLAEFEGRYEREFVAFAEGVAAVDSKLLVLYVPSPFDEELAERVEMHDRAFYRRLAEEQGAQFLDTSEPLGRYPARWTHLLPHNFHLSRLGNQLLARSVAKELKQEPLASHRASWRTQNPPDLLGDLPPHLNRFWQDSHHPFQVTTNNQGLRMSHDLEWPKERPRVLLLGDSFTFGFNVDDVESYPALLQSRLPRWEVVNAGVPGYSIPQQHALFLERARFVEPDVTVLQVLFNDLYGLFYFEQNLYGRDSRQIHQFLEGPVGYGEWGRVEPSALEEEFLAQLMAAP